MFQQGFDLPRPAEAKVAWHLLDRRDAPPRRRGYGLIQVLSNSFTASMTAGWRRS